MAEKVLEVNNLRVNFKTDNGLVKAVRGVSFELYKGETLCIVGESGSGKSVSSKAIMGILANNAIVEDGTIMYEGENLLEISEEEYVNIRGHKIGMIFQDPLSSLNPIMRIGKQITEATLLNGNKLKTLYNKEINEDYIQYRNLVTKKRIELEKAKRKLNDNIAELQSKSKEDSTLKVQNQAEIKRLKDEYKNNKNSIIETINPQIADAKIKLNATKAKAKVTVKEYKDSINEQYLKDLNEAKSNYDLALADYNSKYSGEFESKINSLKSDLDSLDKKSEEALSLIEEINKLEHEKADAYSTINKNYKEALNQAKAKKINNLKITKSEAKRRALEIMKEVGIPQPEKRFKQYPFEFSGGMRQRIVIAIALTANPDVLICDEPTTALDVTIQAQILELINNLKRERELSCIFITHDLGVVANMADRVAVMYAGKIVEYGTAEEVFYDPKHPYTWALLSSIPDVDSKERLDAIPGTPPNMIYPPKGDAFADRSKYAMEIDFKYEPPYFKVTDTHYAATWLLHPDAPKVEMPKIVSERIKKALEREAVSNDKN